MIIPMPCVGFPVVVLSSVEAPLLAESLSTSSKVMVILVFGSTSFTYAATRTDGKVVA